MRTEKEGNLTFYKNNALLRKFILKYIYNYFLYGWLFLIGSIITGFLFLYLFNLTHGFIKYLQLLWLIPTTYCFIRFVRILSTTKYKYRLFRMAHYRLKTRSYSENYFKYDIYEPCTRLIVRDVLYEYKLENEYKLLKSKYLKINQRIEDEKVRILSKVIRQNELKQTQEA